MAKKKNAKPAAAPKRSRLPTLVEFNRNKKRKDCKVCQLPVQLRGEMAQARDKKIERATVREWLVQVHKVKLSDEDLTAHNNGRHDA